MVHILLADGFEEIEALATADILRRAQLEVRLVSISGARNVESSHGLTVKADDIFKKFALDNSDCIILPGGMPGAVNLFKHVWLKRALLSVNEKNGRIAAICASPAVVLGNLGILTSRNATTYPGTEKSEHGANYLDENVVVDENIITAKAPGATFEFAFKIVEALKGIDVVNRVKKEMCLL
jgi:4-methyl-5(b-hydroxyethyl)-thiazole monophosphate biosynthesis